jgi:choline dehydrogenase-like flavoprotein
MLEVEATDMKVANESRVRALGGTTTVWTGGWKFFDPIDFAPRAWVPHSGWPIARAALDPYYARATELAGIRAEPAIRTPLVDGELTTTTFRKQPEALLDWGRVHGPLLERAGNVDVLLGAHLVGLERAGRRIARARVRTDAGELAVDARAHVLAAGGIENARLLLADRLGNDLVGRFYMDHPKGFVGVVETYEPATLAEWGGVSKDDGFWLGYRLSDEVQARERVLNSYAMLEPMHERDLVRRVLRKAIAPRTCRVFRLRNHLEQEPTAEHRVFLTGDRRAGVTWRLTPLDRRSLIELHRHLARTLQRLRIGELHSPLLHDPEKGFAKLIDASHHMGTTRMGTDPRTSVVDVDTRVHGVDNLYVTGSSVFPTSGYANPTATIAALAIRLADHLEATL